MITHQLNVYLYLFFPPFIFISWRLITLQYCSGSDHQPRLDVYLYLNVLEQWSPIFLAPGTSFVEDNFSTDGWGGGGWFWDDSSALSLLCTLFLL